MDTSTSTSISIQEKMFWDEEKLIGSILKKCNGETLEDSNIEKNGKGINVVYTLPCGLRVECKSKGTNINAKWKIDTPSKIKRQRDSVGEYLGLECITIRGKDEGSIAYFQCTEVVVGYPFIYYGVRKGSVDVFTSVYKSRLAYGARETFIKGINKEPESIANYASSDVLSQVLRNGIIKSGELSVEDKIYFLGEYVKLQELLDIERQEVGIGSVLNESDKSGGFSGRIMEIMRILEEIRQGEANLMELEKKLKCFPGCRGKRTNEGALK